MSYNIFLDDWRWPSGVTDVSYPVNTEWTYVIRTAHDFFDCITELKKGVMPCVVSFDYHLDEEMTGMYVLRHMLMDCMTRKVKFPRCFFHSSDPQRRRDMQAVYDVALLRNLELKADNG